MTIDHRAVAGPDPGPRIGTLNEGSLHVQLKELFSQPGDRFEQELDGFVVDIQRGDSIVEIQTGPLAPMGRKLDHLLGRYEVEVVHPIAARTYLIRPGVKARKSPKRRDIHDVLDALVGVPTLLDHPALSLTIPVVAVDAIQERDETLRRGRGGWRVVDRRLREVDEVVRLQSLGDLSDWIPADVPHEFTTADIDRLSPLNRAQAQKLVYCLRLAGLIELVDRSRRGYRYRRSAAAG